MKSTYNEILQNMKAAYNKELGREIAENLLMKKSLKQLQANFTACHATAILF